MEKCQFIYRRTDSICTRFLGIVVYAKNAINAILRLTLGRLLTQSLELKFWCENVAFVLDNEYEAHLKGGAFSLAMSIYV